MGRGIYITLNNFTPFEWTMSGQAWWPHMSAWNPPSSVDPWRVAVFYGETDGFIDIADQGASVTYEIQNGYQSQFTVKLVGADGQLGAYIEYNTIQVDGAASQDGTVNIWGDIAVTGNADQAEANVIIGGQSDANLLFGRDNGQQDWMQHLLGKIGSMTLREICMPYSHDAGMGVVSQSTFGATDGNTRTQDKTIGDQLAAGVRWFDLRPAKRTSDDSWWAGHFSDAGTQDGVQIGWEGSLGQPLGDIIDQINGFTDSHQELLIFELQWGYHVGDMGFDNSQYSYLTQDEWTEVMTLLSSKVNCLYISTSADVTSIPINQFIGQGKSAVLFTYQSPAVDAGDLAGQGFFSFGAGMQIDYTGAYSNSEDPSATVVDQVQKLQQYRHSPTDPAFAMYYTLTLQGADNVEGSIIENSYKINPLAFKELIDICTAQSYPNLLVFDRISEDATLLAISIIFQFALQRPNASQAVATLAAAPVKALEAAANLNTPPLDETLQSGAVPRS